MSDKRERPIEEFSLNKMYTNPDRYEFRCETVLIIPELQIYDKTKNKLVSRLGNMRTVKHIGTMNQKYADDFFKDIEKEARITFFKQISESIKPPQR